jgi:hypothetical protein
MADSSTAEKEPGDATLFCSSSAVDAGELVDAPCVRSRIMSSRLSPLKSATATAAGWPSLPMLRTPGPTPNAPARFCAHAVLLRLQL